MANGHFQLGISPNSDGTFDVNYYGIYGGDRYLETKLDGTLWENIHDDEGEYIGLRQVNLNEVLAQIWQHIQAHRK